MNVPLTGAGLGALLALGILSWLLSFGTGRMVVGFLARKWRRAIGVHWSERARLAFAPSVASIWLLAGLPPVMAFLGSPTVESVNPWFEETGSAFWILAVASLAGVAAARLRWLRELWGSRVTISSWLGGCAVILLALLPHLLVTVLTACAMPSEAGFRSVLVLISGALAIAFFTFGGGLRLLRLLGVARPAPSWLASTVETLARDMKVFGKVRVFELEWAQVNALAWTLHGAVGFSKPMIELMNRDEVRAVAAHELAHLLEPPWVRAVRAAHMFAYLPLLPLMIYGGMPGFLMGYVLFLAILLGYARFGRIMEVRADRTEHESIADGDAYLRSMTKLHQANSAPAVMPGSQTHPHLYDRLLSAGIQPDFPRPCPPRRIVPAFCMVFAIILSALVLAIAGRLIEHWFARSGF